MKLYEYLLNHGVKAKETALFLIRNGFVKVNGRVVKLPEIPVDRRDDIQILDKRHLNVPGSYWKIKEIHEKCKLVRKGDLVLDMESYDGGFPWFAKEEGGEVIVITMKDGLEFLRRKRIHVKRFNLLEDDPKKLTKSKFDIIINELRLDVFKSFQILERFLPFLSSRGRVLMFLSTIEREKEDVENIIEELLTSRGLIPIEFFDERKGFYVFAKK